jgi:hypothetical protein
VIIRTSITSENGQLYEKLDLTWQIGLIKLLWDKWQELWKRRNEDVHRKGMASKAAAEKRDVKRQLLEIYALKNHIEPSARALLCCDLPTHLEQPTWVIQNWLKMCGSYYVRASAKKVTTVAIQGVPLNKIRRKCGTSALAGL